MMPKEIENINEEALLQLLVQSKNYQNELNQSIRRN